MQDRFQSPLFWSVLIGWILSVVLHEFAHGLVAYWGGDYTVRERGGLTLNPIQYIHPVYSLLLPLVFLAMGGVPLPGGATYIRRDLLRNHHWDAACSLAGPFMNLLLFFACAMPFHPRLGWIHPAPFDPIAGPPAVLGTLAILQLVSVFLNLIPVPPLDGFQAISAFMDPVTRQRFYSPQVIMGSTVVLFVLLTQSSFLMRHLFDMTHKTILALGFGDSMWVYFARSFDGVLFGG